MNKFDKKESLNIKNDNVDLSELIDKPNFIFPVVGTEICKTNPEVQKLENLVDVEDGFLMIAFADFFIKKPTTSESKKRISLYSR